MSRHERGRRLSPLRILIAIVLVGAGVVGGGYGVQRWSAEAAEQKASPWFAGYVDATATPAFAFEQLATTAHRDAVLSFIVSSPKSACTPSWGAAYTLRQAESQLDLDRRIARLRQQGGGVAVSFGGQANQELAVPCTSATKLLGAYRSVVQRYGLDTIDLDLEGPGLVDRAAAARRATAIAALQRERRAAGKALAVWVTLPVAPTGLTSGGTAAVARLLASKVDLAGVNAMTMDYGGSRAKGQSMLSASEAALSATQHQLTILYDRAKTHLSSAKAWAKIGATPMIGQNDVPGEIFSMSAATGLNRFARSHGVGRMSMWSANRDVTCGSNYVDVRIVSVACSGVNQHGRTFASVLGTGFKGRVAGSARTVTRADAVTKPRPDDPTSSPYPIWSASAAYLRGTKVTWHHYVYEAKWWTRNDLPDDPVLNSWETPWRLVGPVLPGDKPAAPVRLPKGTFPTWSGVRAYATGAHVLLDGRPFEAKWWNRGESPAAASSNPDGSPWTPISIARAKAIVAAATKGTPSPSPTPIG